MNANILCCFLLICGIVGVQSQTPDPTAFPGVDSFSVIETGSTWILLEWTMDVVSSDFIRYRLVTNPGEPTASTSDINCFSNVCTYNVTYLQPCSTYYFDLTPYYLDGSTLVPGPTASTSGDTADVVPESPTNGEVSRSGSEVTISWEAPANDQCITSYEVCYSSESVTTCYATNDTSISVDDYYFCTDYDVEITSVTESGLRSSPTKFSTNSVYGVPGAVSNYTMLEITEFSAHLTWDKPTNNGSCAHDYTVNWSPVADLGVINNLAGNIGSVESYPMASVSLEQPREFQALLQPLIPCVNYSFTVWAMSPEKEFGPPLTFYDPSKEIDPAQPSDLNIVTMGTHEIFVEWQISDFTCIDHFMLCWRHEKNFIRACMSVFGLQYTISELESCTGYDITVEAVSPNYIESVPIAGAGYTDDEVPGAPMDLQVSDEMATNITIEWNKPEINPQCVAEYTINVIDLNETSIDPLKKRFDSITLQADLSVPVPVANTDFSSLIEGLNSCSYYQISVFAVSPQGLEGPTAVTYGTTDEAKPGLVQDLETFAISETEIEVHWIQPLDNARCAECYDLQWFNVQTGTPGADQVCRVRGDQFDFLYTMEDLEPCTHYTIQIVPRTESNMAGLVDTITGGTACA